MSFHRFLIGHVLDALRSLSDESVHCVVTSPPYWGLRDYGLPPVLWPEVEYAPMPGLPSVRIPAWEGCLGLEPAPEMYVGHLVLIFREIWRVLRKDGTLWLNLGDSYAGSWGNYGAREGKQRSRIAERWQRPAYEVPRHGWDGLPPTAKPAGGLKEKDLTGVPWRAAFALQADGWFFRSEITWCKKAPLPESVKDRPTSATEKIFLFAKGKNYFYDYEAAREPSAGSYRNSSFTKGKTGAVKPDAGRGEREERPGRNSWNYWLLGPEPFPDAHFAVFPTEIPRKAILAGTSPKACPVCGAPWERVTEKVGLIPTGRRGGSKKWADVVKQYRGEKSTENSCFSTGALNFYIAKGFRPICSCPGNDGSARCLVLDPFGGAGTTTLTAMELGRDSIYVDLKREYAEMALKRCGFGGTLLDCHGFEVAEIPAAAETPA